MAEIRVTRTNFKKMALKLGALNRIVLGSSLSDKRTRWFIKRIAETEGYYEEIKNEYECREMAKDLTAMDPAIFAKAVIKAKTWSFLYNYALTEDQIMYMLWGIFEDQDSKVETLDLVDVYLGFLSPYLLSNALMNVKKVRLHNIDADQLLALFELIVRKETCFFQLKEITFLNLTDIPNTMDKGMMKVAARKVSIRIHSLVIPDLQTILNVEDKEEAWRLTRPYDYYTYKAVTDFLFPGV